MVVVYLVGDQIWGVKLQLDETTCTSLTESFNQLFARSQVASLAHIKVSLPIYLSPSAGTLQ